MVLNPREAPAGRVKEGGGGGRGALLSQKGAAGSCKDVCPAHSFSSQPLGGPSVGLTRTQRPAQGKGDVGAKPDPVPQACSLASLELNEEVDNHHHHHYPLAFGGFREIRKECAFGCFYVCVGAFNSP